MRAASHMMPGEEQWMMSGLNALPRGWGRVETGSGGAAQRPIAHGVHRAWPVLISAI